VGFNYGNGLIYVKIFARPWREVRAKNGDCAIFGPVKTVVVRRGPSETNRERACLILREFLLIFPLGPKAPLTGLSDEHLLTGNDRTGNLVKSDNNTHSRFNWANI
jgi:hypothetical protein